MRMLWSAFGLLGVMHALNVRVSKPRGARASAGGFSVFRGGAALGTRLKGWIVWRYVAWTRWCV
jgi:hypothetical protein